MEQQITAHLVATTLELPSIIDGVCVNECQGFLRSKWFPWQPDHFWEKTLKWIKCDIEKNDNARDMNETCIYMFSCMTNFNMILILCLLVAMVTKNWKNCNFWAFFGHLKKKSFMLGIR